MTLQNEVVQKINALLGVKGKVLQVFLSSFLSCPVLACVATCISVQTKISQPAQLVQLKGIRSSMTSTARPEV